MIFGKTHEQRAEQAHRRNVNKAKLVKLHRRFALFPTRLNDGRYVWLQSYWRTAIVYFSSTQRRIVGVRFDRLPIDQHTEALEEARTNVELLRDDGLEANRIANDAGLPPVSA